MKIFPDANVLVAAFLWEEGLCAKIVKTLLQEKQHDLIVGEGVLEKAKDTWLSNNTARGPTKHRPH